MDRHTRGAGKSIVEIMVVPGGPDSALQAVVFEEEVVVDGPLDVPTAFHVLFGIFMISHIEYLPGFKCLFENGQKIFLSLDSENCSAQIQTLRTKLSQL